MPVDNPVEIAATFMRGGTSKGVFFTNDALPDDQRLRDQIFLQILGSPDPYMRQLNGLGGGISSLSKIAVVGLSDRPDADVDYTFGQVAVDIPVVDYQGNCGNLASAVGPFAIHAGLLSPPDGTTTVRIHNTNTGKLIHAVFEVADGRPREGGDLAIPGVAGTGAPISLEFQNPGGAVTGALLPTGRTVDRLSPAGLDLDVTATLADAANPAVIVMAGDLGLCGAESIEALESDAGLMSRLEALRRAGAVAMGMAATPSEARDAVPKIVIVGAAQPSITLDGQAVGDHDLTVRALSMGRVHKAVPVTMALCLATATRLPGSVPATAAQGANPDTALRMATPSGVVVVDAAVDTSGSPSAETASLQRTARRLMSGHAHIADLQLGSLTESPERPT